MVGFALFVVEHTTTGFLTDATSCGSMEAPGPSRIVLTKNSDALLLILKNCETLTLKNKTFLVLAFQTRIFLLSNFSYVNLGKINHNFVDNFLFAFPLTSLFVITLTMDGKVSVISCMTATCDVVICTVFKVVAVRGHK